MATPSSGGDIKRKNVSFAQEESREVQKKSKPVSEVNAGQGPTQDHEAYLQETTKFFENLYKLQEKEVEDVGAKQEKILADFYAASTTRIEKRSTRSFALLEELFQQLERNEQLRQQLKVMEDNAKQLFHNLFGEQ